MMVFLFACEIDQMHATYAYYPLVSLAVNPYENLMHISFKKLVVDANAKPIMKKSNEIRNIRQNEENEMEWKDW